MTVLSILQSLGPIDARNIRRDELLRWIIFAPVAMALLIRFLFPTILGRGTVTLPPGTASGSKLRLRGQGAPRRGTDQRGDQYVVIQIVPPKRLTEKEQQLYEQLRGQEDFNPREHTEWAQARAGSKA